MENQPMPILLPTFSSSMNHGWETMKRDFLRLFLVILVVMIITWPMALLQSLEDTQTAGAIILGILGMAFFFMIFPVFKYSAAFMFLQAVRGEKIDMKDIIKGFDRYLNVVLAYLLKAALIALGMVALIVPGIIVACRLAFVSYLVMDKNLDPVAAVEESWRMTRGFGWTIFGMAIVSIFIAIGGFILLFVGIFPAAIWIHASFASLYHAVDSRILPNGLDPEMPVEG